MLQQWYNIRYIQDWVAQSSIEANLLLNIYQLWTFYEVNMLYMDLLGLY